jgi:Cu/Ag efflux protein CusF
MNKKALGIVAGALIAAAPLVSSAADALPAPFEGASVLQADGIVKGVDQAKHAVTVIDAHGGEASFAVTDASNLAQIHPGSKVHVRMVRSALVSPTHGAAGVQSSPQNVTAEVVALDRASGVVELKGPNGAVFHIQGRDPVKVGNLQPGMHVEVAYASEVSVAVAPAAQ